MAKVLHTCSGCVPIDVAIIDVYVALLKMLDLHRGPRGLSAYEVAVKDGYEGTEEEWLASLKGEQGEMGERGAAGPTGPTGPTGATGAQGEKGDKGDTGLTGPTGPMGPAGVSSATVSVGQTTGNPSGTISVSNGVLSLSLSGIKGEQGNTGSSVAYPFELVNSRYGGGVDKAWSAEQGKLLAEAVCYLGEVVETI